MTVLREHLGEIAALGTATCWVFTALAFAAAGRRIGPTAVNVARIFLALSVLTAVHRLVWGTWVPELDGRALLLLGLSGLIGLAIGDQFLFTALVEIGSRLTTLLGMTIAPPVAALIAWRLLDERLELVQIAGMAVTLGGIAWVVLERQPPRIAAAQPKPRIAAPEPGVTAGSGAASAPRRRMRRGVAFGAAAGVCQAVGIVLSKLGMGHGSEGVRVEPWAANMVRMAFAAVGVLVVAAFLRAICGSAARSAAIRPRRGIPFAILMVMTGATLGPVTGVYLSLVAVDRTEAGIASTIMAMTPVLILPLAAWVERERVSWRAVVGAFVAVAGVGILALS